MDNLRRRRFDVDSAGLYLPSSFFESPISDSGGLEVKRVRLLGGPLEGATIETSKNSIEPEMVHFSDSGRVHHYLRHLRTEYRYLCRNTFLHEPGSFEEWWKGQNAGGAMKDEASKAIAWEAWQAVLANF